MKKIFTIFLFLSLLITKSSNVVFAQFQPKIVPQDLDINFKNAEVIVKKGLKVLNSKKKISGNLKIEGSNFNPKLNVVLNDYFRFVGNITEFSANLPIELAMSNSKIRANEKTGAEMYLYVKNQSAETHAGSLSGGGFILEGSFQLNPTESDTIIEFKLTFNKKRFFDSLQENIPVVHDFYFTGLNLLAIDPKNITKSAQSISEIALKGSLNFYFDSLTKFLMVSIFENGNIDTLSIQMVHVKGDFENGAFLYEFPAEKWRIFLLIDKDNQVKMWLGIGEASPSQAYALVPDDLKTLHFESLDVNKTRRSSIINLNYVVTKQVQLKRPIPMALLCNAIMVPSSIISELNDNIYEDLNALKNGKKSFINLNIPQSNLKYFYRNIDKAVKW